VPGCAADMSLPRMTQVDHIVEVRDGGDFWSMSNLRTVCRFHHYSKSIAVMSERRFGRRVEVQRPDRKPGNPGWCWHVNRDGEWEPSSPNGGICEWPGCQREHWPGFYRPRTSGNEVEVSRRHGGDGRTSKGDSNE
jgi:hypothetical protein